MIESNIIKRFLVKKFMQNNDNNTVNVAELAFKNLSTRFFLNETVIVISKNAVGKIVAFSKDDNMYGVQLEDSVVNVPFEDIKRRIPVEIADIYNFFELITVPTPLGRILIENVFEKISKPGFGGRQRHQTSPFASVIHKNTPHPTAAYHQARVPNNEQIEEKKSTPKLNVEDLKKLEISGFDEIKLSKLLKIYCFFSKFYKLTHIKSLSLEHLSKDILSADYNTQLIMKFHKFLVETIEKDIDVYKVKFINETRLLLEGLPVFKLADGLSNQLKKRSLIDQNNWKSETKIFLSNFAMNSENENVLGLFQKDDVSSRLDLLDFLINLAYFTDNVRNYVHDSQVVAKIEDTSNKKNIDSDQESTDNDEALQNLLSNPLRAHIGCYQNKLMFLVDKSIMMKDENRYYVLGLKDAKMILKDLDSKSDKVAMMNLKMIIHDLEK